MTSVSFAPSTFLSTFGDESGKSSKIIGTEQPKIIGAELVKIIGAETSPLIGMEQPKIIGADQPKIIGVEPVKIITSLNEDDGENPLGSKFQIVV